MARQTSVRALPRMPAFSSAALAPVVVDGRGVGGYIARSPGGARRPGAQVAKW